MNIKNIVFKYNTPLTGVLLEKIKSISKGTEYIFTGVINTNSNIKVFKSLFYQNTVPVITLNDGKTYLDKNIFQKNKLSPVAYDNGTSFSVNCSENYDFGQFTININFPAPQYNINGYSTINCYYFNNGQFSNWTSHGFLIDNCTYGNTNCIPINLNGFTLTLANNNIINCSINGIIIANNNTQINYSDNVTINSSISNTIINNCNSVKNNSNEINTFYFNKKVFNNSTNSIFQNNIISSAVKITSNTNNKNNFIYQQIPNNIINNYIQNGDFTILSSYLNTQNNKNVLGNHYHDTFQKQTKHYHQNYDNGYICNAPIGAIVWWPESWINKQIDKNGASYFHKPYPINQDWVVCDGQSYPESIYQKIYNNKIPNFQLSTIYNYKNVYNSYNETYQETDNHYCDEPSSTVLLYPKSLKIHPQSFYSQGTSSWDCSRTCVYNKMGNGFLIKTTSNYNCKSSLNLKFDIGNIKQMIFPISCSFLTYATKPVKQTVKIVPSQELTYTFGSIPDQTNVTKWTFEIVSQSDIDSKKSEKNINLDISVIQNGKNLYLKVFDFKINVENNTLSVFKTGSDDTSSNQIKDSYRYGFPNRTEKITSIGFTNYGYFRRLVPLIKINNNYNYPHISIPESLDSEGGYIKLIKVRKNFSDKFYDTNVCKRSEVSKYYLSACYSPFNGISAFENNIFNTEQYVLTADLSDYTKSFINVISGTTYGTYEKYTKSSDNFYYLKHYIGNDIINNFINGELINHIVFDTLHKCNPYSENNTLDYDALDFSNVSLIPGDNDYTFTININQDITKMYLSYLSLNLIKSLIINAPLQQNNTEAFPQQDYQYSETPSNCSAGFQYYIAGISGNLPFVYNSVKPPENCSFGTSQSYNLYGTDTTLWDVNNISISNISNPIINYSLFQAKNIGNTNNTYQPTNGAYDTLLYYRMPSNYSELTKLLDTKQPNHTNFWAEFIKMFNTNTTKNYWYRPSCLSGKHETDNYPLRIKFLTNPTQTANSFSIRIPPNSTLDNTNFTQIGEITQSNFEKYMNQYDESLYLCTENTFSSSDTITIKTGYLKRMRDMSTKLLRSLQYVHEQTLDTITGSDLVSRFQNFNGNNRWSQIVTYFNPKSTTMWDGAKIKTYIDNQTKFGMF